MATNTENLNLKKPAQEDFYNVDDFNENFQKIDDFAGKCITEDGGTICEDVTINKEWAKLTLTDKSGREAYVEKHPTTGHISMNTRNDNSNHNALKLAPETQDILDGVIFENTVGGVTSKYRMLHEGNFSDLAGDFGTTRILTGTYVGTGLYGYDHPTVLEIPFDIKLAIITPIGGDSYAFSSGNAYQSPLVLVKGTTGAVYACNDQNNVVKLVKVVVCWNGGRLSFYSGEAYQQLNRKDVTYNYVLLG